MHYISLCVAIFKFCLLNNLVFQRIQRLLLQKKKVYRTIHTWFWSYFFTTEHDRGNLMKTPIHLCHRKIEPRHRGPNMGTKRTTTMAHNFSSLWKSVYYNILLPLPTPNSYWSISIGPYIIKCHIQIMSKSEKQQLQRCKVFPWQRWYLSLLLYRLLLYLPSHLLQ